MAIGPVYWLSLTLLNCLHSIICVVISFNINPGREPTITTVEEGGFVFGDVFVIEKQILIITSSTQSKLHTAITIIGENKYQKLLAQIAKMMFKVGEILICVPSGHMLKVSPHNMVINMGLILVLLVLD